MDDLIQLILCVYRLAQETSADEFQSLALGPLKSILPFDSCRWGTALTYSTERLIFEHVYQENEEPGIMEAYAEVAHLDLFGLEAAANPWQTVNFNARHAFAGRAHYSPFLDYLRRFRHENLLVTGVVSPNGMARSLSYYRRDPDEHFSERERQVSQAVFPHLMEALLINLKLNLAQLDDKSGAARWPLGACTSDGLLLYAEEAFVKLLAREWPRRATSRLPQAVVESLLIRGHTCHLSEQLCLSIARRQGRITYLRARARLPVDDLSARELQVARLVACGKSFKEIALTLKLSPATVRNHIQHIHERLEVRSNAELASRLACAAP